GRALEKLRHFFVKRGVVLSVAVVGVAPSANAVQAAPGGLAATAAAADVVKGTSIAASTITLVNGALKLMTLAKLKTAAALGLAVVLATGTTVVVSKVVAQSS